MIRFPNSKINLGLRIKAKRKDGYHDLETLMYPLRASDALELIRANRFSFHFTGLPIPGSPGDNLCVKAWKLVKKLRPRIPNVHLHLHKVIPPGTGLGGGSSDGAYTVQLLDECFSLRLTKAEKLACAIQLGSDCAFFLENRPCLATGRGEILDPVSLDLNEYRIQVICPHLQISTAAAYAMVKPAKVSNTISQIIRLPLIEWKDRLINDFEQPLFQQFPLLANIKAKLYDGGAVYASMSGSGSAVYGIFYKKNTAILSWEDGCQVFDC